MAGGNKPNQGRVRQGGGGQPRGDMMRPNVQGVQPQPSFQGGGQMGPRMPGGGQMPQQPPRTGKGLKPTPRVLF